MTRRKATSFVLFCAWLAPVEHVDGRAPRSPRAQVAEVIRLSPYRGRLCTVPVKVAGRELQFLVDTAGGITFLAPDTAKATGCRRHGKITAFRMRGERLEAPRCVGGTISVGTHVVAQDFAVLDVGSMLPADWPRVAGSLSLLSLESVPFTLDLAGKELRLESEESLAAAVRSMTPLLYRESRPAGGAGLDVFVAVDASPAPLWFELDSGNTGPVLVSTEVASLVEIRAARRHDRSMERVATATVVLPGLPPMVAPAQTVELIYDGNLGAEFMEKLVFVFDLSRGRIWARLR